MSAGDFTLDLQRIDEATQWLQTLREGTVDESTLARWLQWSADTRNLREFERLQCIWDGVSTLRQRAMLPERKSGLRPLAPAAKLAAGIVLVAGLSLLAWNFLSKPGRSYETDVAAIAYVPLSDGSRVQLGALSAVKERFTAQTRLVSVESGEAYFEVAKDVRRPFIVEAGAVRVTAIGTAFNVHRSNDKVRVTVTEGTINATTVQTLPGATAPLTAGAGEQVEYSISGNRLSVSRADVKVATGWRSGVLKFVDEPLQNVVADLNRYSERKIIIDDARLNALPYTGTVFAGRIDQWLLAAQDAFPLYMREEGASAVRLRMK